MRFVRSFKLSDWCLQVIIENLNLFIYNETVVGKKVDFLFRVYSEELYHHYSNKNCMTEECMLWFLNHHNKKVTLNHLSENIIARLQVVGSRITSLTLYESLASEKMINSIVCCIPNVTYLDLSSSDCSNRTLLCIQRFCQELITLKIEGCSSVTNYGMNYLSGNQSIRNLNLLLCKISYEGLWTVLQGIPFLQCLEFECLGNLLYYFHEEDFKTGAYKNVNYNLTEFSMQVCDNPFQLTWAWTVLCPNIKKVCFEFPVSSKVIELCKNFENLEELKMQILPSSAKFTDYFTSVLPIANNLRKLALSFLKIPIITLLENLHGLKVLYLKHVTFLDFDQEIIKIQETKLETLFIQGTDMQCPHTSYKAVAFLISISKNVTKLYLNQVKNLSQELFDIIINSMTRLTFVDLSFSSMKLCSINCFFKMPSLRIIHCDSCIGFSLNEDTAIKNSLSENYCSLSWRIMYNDVEEYYDAYRNIIL